MEQAHIWKVMQFFRIADSWLISHWLGLVVWGICKREPWIWCPRGIGSEIKNFSQMTGRTISFLLDKVVKKKYLEERTSHITHGMWVNSQRSGQPKEEFTIYTSLQWAAFRLGGGFYMCLQYPNLLGSQNIRIHNHTNICDASWEQNELIAIGYFLVVVYSVFIDVEHM